MKADASQIHQVVDMMYAEFVKKEQKSDKSPLVSSSRSHNRSLRWIIGASVSVLLLISIAVGVFIVMPLVHPALANTLPDVPSAPMCDTPIQSSVPPSVRTIWI